MNFDRRQALLALTATASGRLRAADSPAPARPYRIFHVMSFESPWRWTDGQWQGFRESLGATPYESRVFQMNVKRHSAPEAKARQGAEARALIDAWKPDLLYFWIDRVHYGVLASSTISELAQGRAAGQLARAILIDGRVPSSLPIEPTRLGNPALNLARARQLGLPVRSGLLLSAEVIKQFEWERPAS
ncbi:MAG TPA: hypothetical protein PK359_17505 [Burkholderiaceae bacterium]|nr:hypothetical protein [Burkholderiaceae bacterium]